MKKQSPIFIFFVIFAIGVSTFSMVVMVTPFSNMFFVFVLIAAMIMFGSFITIAKGITSGAIEEKMSRRKTCPHCSNSIPVESVYCPTCGKNVEKTVICSYCGEPNPEGIIQCEKCKGLL